MMVRRGFLCGKNGLQTGVEIGGRDGYGQDFGVGANV
jgi:hypothetical protein